jgi:hypothetical protein
MCACNQSWLKASGNSCVPPRGDCSWSEPKIAIELAFLLIVVCCSEGNVGCVRSF